MQQHYHVVIVKADGGIVSRHHGTAYEAALAQAQQRRIDFPNAKEIRVISPDNGVLAVL